jgi:transcriptional regulator with XRE-family HTH domain
MKNDYHYTESGLQNVFISGIEAVLDDDGDEVITIPAINDLHAVISIGIVSHKNSISGDELKFLRTELGYTQAQLAELVHHERQSIGRWESGKVVMDSASEALIRKLAIEKLVLDVEFGIDDISRHCVPSANNQTINISKQKTGDNDSYSLEAA